MHVWKHKNTRRQLRHYYSRLSESSVSLFEISEFARCSGKGLGANGKRFILEQGKSTFPYFHETNQTFFELRNMFHLCKSYTSVC